MKRTRHPLSLPGRTPPGRSSAPVAAGATKALALLLGLAALLLAACNQPAAAPPSEQEPSSTVLDAPPAASSSQPEEEQPDPLPSYGAAFSSKDEYLAVLTDTLNAILARYGSGQYPVQRQFSAGEDRLVGVAPGAAPQGVTLPESVTWEDIQNTCNPGWVDDGGEAGAYTVQGSVILENDIYMNFQFSILTPDAAKTIAYAEPEVFFYDPAIKQTTLEAPLLLKGVTFSGEASGSATDVYAESFAYEEVYGSATLYIPERYVIFSFSDTEGGEFWGGAVYLFDEEGQFTAAPLPPSGVTTNPDDPWGAALVEPAALKDPLLEEKLMEVLAALLQIPAAIAE